jgi:hypothetical protein
MPDEPPVPEPGSLEAIAAAYRSRNTPWGLSRLAPGESGPPASTTPPAPPPPPPSVKERCQAVIEHRQQNAGFGLRPLDGLLGYQKKPQLPPPPIVQTPRATKRQR